jgi:hypothetical protein
MLLIARQPRVSPQQAVESESCNARMNQNAALQQSFLQCECLGTATMVKFEALKKSPLTFEKAIADSKPID